MKLGSTLYEILDALDSWTEIDNLLSLSIAPEAVVREAVERLSAHGLIDIGSEQPTAQVWQFWGPIAHRFHTDSRDAAYPETADERTELAEAVVSSGTPPDIFKSYPDKPVVQLPRAHAALRMSLGDALITRRTHRYFDGRPVSIDDLSTILHYTFAPQRFSDSGLFNVQQMRTSPSAGGRHEVECYVASLNVSGIPGGLYHYNPLSHALELLDETVGRETIADLTYSQRQCCECCFLCLTTVVSDRLAWKYRHPRAYRLWMYDAGHYGQTFALVCTALGLGPFQTAAFRDTAMETALALEGDSEFAAYVLGAGFPDEPSGSRCLPQDYAAPRPFMIN
jgi:SagB-type dehydrogenase family enzyme